MSSFRFQPDGWNGKGVGHCAATWPISGARNPRTCLELDGCARIVRSGGVKITQSGAVGNLLSKGSQSPLRLRDLQQIQEHRCTVFIKKIVSKHGKVHQFPYVGNQKIDLCFLEVDIVKPEIASLGGVILLGLDVKGCQGKTPLKPPVSPYPK